MDLIGTVALILSLIGAVALEWMRRSISTRYIGKFPDHLERITRLVRNAVIRIDSLADCVDYGSFFNPGAHEQLIQEIIEAKQKRSVPVRMLVCDGPKPISAASTWGQTDFSKRLADPEFRKYLTHYLNVLSKEGTLAVSKVGFKKFLVDDGVIERLTKGNSEPGYETELRVLLLRRHAWFRDRLTTYLTDGAEVRYDPLRSDVFLWIIDDVEPELCTQPTSQATVSLGDCRS